MCRRCDKALVETSFAPLKSGPLVKIMTSAMATFVVVVSLRMSMASAFMLSRTGPQVIDAKRRLGPIYLFDFMKQKADDLGELIERKRKEDIETVLKFQEGLRKSRNELLSSILEAIEGKSGEALIQELEEALLLADIGYSTTELILDDVRRASARDEADVKAILRGRLLEVVGPPVPLAFAEEEEGPTVISVIGSNGMGKTTTIGKLAKRLKNRGNKVLVAACDTFRAAAVDQLVEWTRRAEVDIFFDAPESAPSAVAYRALDKALAEDYDVVLVDTSGRLANNVALTEELKKIQRTIGKRVSGAPHETLLVLDASVGRNALDQARIWRDECGVSGIVVTKLDGTSRAGFCVSVKSELDLPVKLVGVGESIDDLRDFNPALFVDSLLDIDADQAEDLTRYFQAQLRNSAVDDSSPSQPTPREPTASSPSSSTRKNKRKRAKRKKSTSRNR